MVWNRVYLIGRATKSCVTILITRNRWKHFLTTLIASHSRHPDYSQMRSEFRSMLFLVIQWSNWTIEPNSCSTFLFKLEEEDNEEDEKWRDNIHPKSFRRYTRKAVRPHGIRLFFFFFFILCDAAIFISFSFFFCCWCKSKSCAEDKLHQKGSFHLSLQYLSFQYDGRLSLIPYSVHTIRIFSLVIFFYLLFISSLYPLLLLLSSLSSTIFRCPFSLFKLAACWLFVRHVHCDSSDIWCKCMYPKYFFLFSFSHFFFRCFFCSLHLLFFSFQKMHSDSSSSSSKCERNPLKISYADSDANANIWIGKR